MKIIARTILLVILLPTFSWAKQDTFLPGKSAMPQDGISARATAMGSAVTGVHLGLSSLFWNPAGLGAMDDGTEIALHHDSGLGDSTKEVLVIGKGGLAGSFSYMNNGTFEGRNNFGIQTGNYGAGTVGGSLGWGVIIDPGLSVGFSGKFNHQTLAKKSYSSFAMDSGVLWNPFTRLNLGATYTNWGTKVVGRKLDGGWNFGASYGINSNILLAASSELRAGGFNQYNLGVEGKVHPAIALRGGYIYSAKPSHLSDLTDFTMGLGIVLNKSMVFDYAYLPYGELGSSHRLSLSYKFRSNPDDGKLIYQGGK